MKNRNAIDCFDAKIVQLKLYTKILSLLIMIKV